MAARLTLTDLPFDVLELVALTLARGGDDESDPAALSHLASTCSALRSASHSALARLAHLDLTPPRVVSHLIPRRHDASRSGGGAATSTSSTPSTSTTTTATRPPTPAELARAAPLVAALLRRCTAAVSVDLSRGHAYVNDATVDALVAGPSCSKLRDVRLSYCASLTGAALARLGAAAPRITTLHLAAVPAAGEPGVLDGFTALVDLDVSWVRAFGGGSSRRPLVRAALRGCEGVGDDAVAAMASPSMEHLDVAFTPVTDAGLACVAAASPRLKTLVVASSERTDAIWSLGFFTAGGLRRFRAAAPQCEVVLVAS